MTYFLGFFISLVLSIFATGIVRSLGFRKKIFAEIRERDVHKKPIPRIGGIAIFLSFLITLTIFLLVFKTNFGFAGSAVFGLDSKFIGIILGSTLVVISMFFDDLFGLKAWQKSIFQILAAIVAISGGIGIDTLTNPFGGEINLNSIYVPLFSVSGTMVHFSLWSDLLTLVWLVGMMNVINFVDGIDGLASGISTIAAFTIFLLSISLAVNQPSTALIAIILAGSTAGFLFWNFPPAKIFMGDAGSMFLGYILGVLPLISGGKLATAFLVLGFPIVDGLFVAGGRILRGKNPFTTPDKTHLHHRFLAAGFSVREAVLSLYVIAIAFAWVALRSTTMNKIIASIILILLLIGIIVLLRMRAKQMTES
ncbi:MAG: MraY family glycosyltransferase [Patescibacteria group bacterium]